MIESQRKYIAFIEKSTTMRKIIFLIIFNQGLFNVLPIHSQIGTQSNSVITRTYLEAEKLFKEGNYSAVLAYLKNQTGNQTGFSDSLSYLKIVSLQRLYNSSIDLTMDLENSLNQFLSRVNRIVFPELKYSEVSSVYTEFQFFKEKDRRFYDSVAKVTDLKRPTDLPAIRIVILEYLKKTLNTYNSKELNEYVSSINKQLSDLATVRNKQIADSTNIENLKKVGKLLSLTLAYAIPSVGGGRIRSIQNYSDVLNFFNGQINSGLGEKYALNASLAEALFNIHTSPLIKLSINWNLFEAEYAVFDWSPNSIIMDKESSGKVLNELKTLKAGTRIGPIILIRMTKNITGAVYYSARPGVQFIMRSSYFEQSNGSVSESYRIKPVVSNFNLTNEVGIKFYFFKKLFINPYLHFGKYKWKNEIINLSPISGSTIQVQTNYDLKYIGFRIGF